MVNSFKLIRAPAIYFGHGQIDTIPEILSKRGKRLLIITGAGSYRHNAGVLRVFSLLEGFGFILNHETISKEPSPADVDSIVLKYQKNDTDAVLAIGGGSVLDTGKAVSAMLPVRGPVCDYLEGVGKKSHPGEKIFFMAIPTTAGTGSEATANAVLSETGVNGFKRSLRHENLVPDVAIVDPALTLGCPEDITAASGMDAFTQLIESYLSTKASPLTDALSLSGISSIHQCLVRSVLQGNDLEARSGMAYAALLSGITLSNAGLGLIHGFASAIGGLFNAPHGVICGTMMGIVNQHMITALLHQPPITPAHDKYARLGELFSGTTGKSKQWYMGFTADYLINITTKLQLSKLGKYGISAADLVRIAESTDHKANPVKFEKNQLVEMLTERL